jgi:hypothetical protein
MIEIFGSFIEETVACCVKVMKEVSLARVEGFCVAVVEKI